MCDASFFMPLSLKSELASKTPPTNTVSPARPTASSGCDGAAAALLLHDIPDTDAACGMAAGGNHTDILAACCGGAAVAMYANHCGLYCRAQGQTADELASCMSRHGAPRADVFCSGGGGGDTAKGSASATAAAATAKGAATATPAAAGGAAASALGTGGARATGGASSSSSSSSSSPSGAASGPQAGGTAGLVVSALLFTSVVFGALRL